MGNNTQGKSAIWKFLSLVKFGIVFGNLIPVIAGFVLARGESVILLLHVILWTSLVISSGCVINNYIDRDIDPIMERTKNRVLAKGEIPANVALVFGVLLGIVGLFGAYIFLNILAFTLLAFGLFSYVVLYTILAKRNSMYGVHIGSISGAMPPLIGFVSVSGSIELSGLLFFFMLVVWQMPHSFAIEIFRFNDYKNAKIPTVPAIKGLKYTKYSMLGYVFIFTIINLAMYCLEYTGLVHILTAYFINFWWLYVVIQGLKIENINIELNKKWARKTFFLSILNMMAICFAIIVDKIIF
jgi:protoheme IX farnesyltransferase